MVVNLVSAKRKSAVMTVTAMQFLLLQNTAKMEMFIRMFTLLYVILENALKRQTLWRQTGSGHDQMKTYSLVI